jgi:hypothetical protein
MDCTDQLGLKTTTFLFISLNVTTAGSHQASYPLDTILSFPRSKGSQSLNAVIPFHISRCWNTCIVMDTPISTLLLRACCETDSCQPQNFPFLYDLWTLETGDTDFGV